MLGVIDDALTIGFEIRNRLFDDSQIIFVCGEQYFLYVKSPRFAEDSADGCIRVNERFDVGIVFGSTFDAAGRAKRGNQCILPLRIAGALEEFNIFRIRTGPAALDEGYAEFIQFLCDADLVITRKCEAFRLRPIAESGVVYLDLLHKYPFSATGFAEILRKKLKELYPLWLTKVRLKSGNVFLKT